MDSNYRIESRRNATWKAVVIRGYGGASV